MICENPVAQQPSSPKWVTAVASSLKILVGVLFVFSALAKLISVEAFEMYVFSFGLFPLVLCQYISRLVLIFELLLGVALISHRHHRFTVLMTLLFLLVFIVFLAYAHLSGRTDSCHCFGELLPFDPVQSIVKNAVLIALLLFVFKYASVDWAPRWWLVLIVYLGMVAVALAYMFLKVHVLYFQALIALMAMLLVGLFASFRFYDRWYVSLALIAVPFITVLSLSPPDSWLFSGDQEHFNSTLFASELVSPSPENDDDADLLAEVGLDEGKHVVAFLSPTCSACMLTAEKLSTIALRNGFDTSRVCYVFPKIKHEEFYRLFVENSHAADLRQYHITSRVFIRLVEGSFPKVVLVEDGAVKAVYGYNSLSERSVSQFMSTSSE